MRKIQPCNIIEWLMPLVLLMGICCMLSALANGELAEHEAEHQEKITPVIVTEPYTASPLPEFPEPVCMRVSTLVGSFRTTAYCNCDKCCGKWAGGLTASGTVPTEGRTIAADPAVLPMGSVVTIGGHEYTVEDTGSAIKGNRIDIYFDHHEDALEYGVQWRDVWTEKENLYAKIQKCGYKRIRVEKLVKKP